MDWLHFVICLPFNLLPQVLNANVVYDSQEYQEHPLGEDCHTLLHTSVHWRK